MDNDQPAPAPRERSPFGFAAVMVALAVGAYFLLHMNGPAESQDVGVPFPPLEVHGWFNVDRPLTTEDLRGKVVLLDCWFVGCPPCRAAMPRLVEFNKRFRGQEFQLVGLTVDTGEDAHQAELFAKTIPGFDWPVGYGAQIPVMDILGVYEFPTMFLFDKSGRSVWKGHSEYGLEEAVVKALAAPPPTLTPDT